MKSRIRAQREPLVLVLKNNPGNRAYGGLMSRKQKGGHSLDAYVHKPDSQTYVHSPVPGGPLNMSQSRVLRGTTRSVDLGESFQTHIYAQNLASIQPRTSLVKERAP